MSAQIKASYFAGNVAALAILGPEKEAIARARLQTAIAALNAASRADWIPIEHDDALSDVVCELGGVQAIRDVNRQSFLSSVDGPLIRPLFQGAIKLLGMSPKAGLRFFSRGWEAGMKEAGRIDVVIDKDDGGGTLVHSGYVADRNWHEGLVGIIEGIYVVTRHVGPIELKIEKDRAVYACRWKPQP